MDYIISDQHWGHNNIRLLSVHRDFEDLSHMNEHMVKAWNERVSPGDTVYHLGDIFWNTETAEAILPRLQGKIKLIVGNHDYWLDDLNTIDTQGKITLISRITRLKFNKTKIWMCHYPLRVWEGNFRGAMHVYGHCHGSIENDRLMRSMDMSVDVAGYQPWTVEEVWTKLMRDPIKPEELRISGGLSYTDAKHRSK